MLFFVIRKKRAPVILSGAACKAAQSKDLFSPLSHRMQNVECRVQNCGKFS